MPNITEAGIKSIVRNMIDPLIMKFRQDIYGSGISFNPTISLGAVPDLTPIGYIKGIKTYIGTILLGSQQTEISMSGKGGISVTGSVGGTRTSYVVSGSNSPTGGAGGDLTGSYPNPTVAGIYNVPVSSTAPVQGQLLQYDGTQWKPTNPGSGIPRVIAGWFFYNPLSVGSGTSDYGPVYQIDAYVTISGLWGNSYVTATATNTFNIGWSTDLINWQSIYNTKPTIISGSRINTQGVLAKTIFSPNDFIRFEVTSLAGVTLSGVTMQLRVIGR